MELSIYILDNKNSLIKSLNQRIDALQQIRKVQGQTEYCKWYNNVKDTPPHSSARTLFRIHIRWDTKIQQQSHETSNRKEVGCSWQRVCFHGQITKRMWMAECKVIQFAYNCPLCPKNIPNKIPEYLYEKLSNRHRYETRQAAKYQENQG